jgi:endonuclease/exonuclease/phosphatase family metal-dependent hydrolase
VRAVASLLSVVCAVAIAVAGNDQASAPAADDARRAQVAGGGRPLRLITFNLFHGGQYSSWNGDAKELDTRLAMVIDELRALDPDVIALQEASEGRRRGIVAQRIAEALGFHYVFEPSSLRATPLRLLNRLAASVLDFAEGLAVVSRFPITGFEVYDLPRCQRRLEPRVLLRADVATPRGLLAVFTTHISRDPCQVREVGEIVRARALTGPVVLTGDLNRIETGEGMEGIGGSGGLIDAFRAAHPTAVGATVWQRIDADEATATRRVDYIFVGGPGARPGIVCGSRVVLNRPTRGADGRTLWPSDHYGVLADLALFGIKCAP